MALSWAVIKGTLEAAKVVVTGASDLKTAKDKAEAAKIIGDLSDQVRELWDRVTALEEENRQLIESQKVKADIERQPAGYFVVRETGQKICGLCWEKSQAVRTLLPKKKQGIASSGGRPGTGHSSWTEFLKCPDCGTEYGHESKSSRF